MYHIFCIHSSVEGHLGSFQLLAIINKAAMNIVERVSLVQVGTSFGYMPRRGIAGSSGSTLSNGLRNRQTDFQSGCTSLQSRGWDFFDSDSMVAKDRVIYLSPFSSSFPSVFVNICCLCRAPLPINMFSQPSLDHTSMAVEFRWDSMAREGPRGLHCFCQHISFCCDELFYPQSLSFLPPQLPSPAKALASPGMFPACLLLS